MIDCGACGKRVDPTERHSFLDCFDHKTGQAAILNFIDRVRDEVALHSAADDFRTACICYVCDAFERVAQEYEHSEGAGD